MQFKLDPDEHRRYVIWNERHINEKHNGEEPDVGAIGGRVTFLITGTSLGKILNVQCVCGVKECLTDFSDW